LRQTAGAAMQARSIETRPEDGAGDHEVPGHRASPILSALHEIHDRYRRDVSGRVATYIPELAKADPELFGIALATSDGATYETGDSRRTFTIQSISKPFVYGLALEDRGREQVLGKVGVEPSGNAFNSIVFDERHQRPFNAMVNAGAIVTTALIGGDGYGERLARLVAMLSRYAGRSLQIDDAVLASERGTGHRNRAIAYLALNGGMIDSRVEEHLDLYFAQCSVLVSARDLAVMAATLANHGINPITGARALDGRYVESVLSVMLSCGMYDYSGEWVHRVGLPAKSGVSGGIIAIRPGQLGIASFSPPLDERGNSRRGIQACEALSERFRLHMFKSAPATRVVFRRRYRGTSARSKRHRTRQEQRILDAKAAGIAVYELQGALHFASMEEVLRQITDDVASISHLVLDMTRVLQIDDCAAALIGEIRGMLQVQSKVVALAHLRPEIGDALLGATAAADPGLAAFADSDAALEWCENCILLESLPAGVSEIPVPLASMDAVAGLDDGDRARLEAIMRQASYPAGAAIIREGDTADALFLLAEGRVSVWLGLAEGRRKRLATVTPGVAFGDLALFGGGPRSADVIADEPSLCYVLPVERLDVLSRSHPEVRTRLMANLAREMAARLRSADAEIRTLEE
jgi:glutaminase